MAMHTTSTSKARTTRVADKVANVPATPLADMKRAPTPPGEIFAEEFLAHTNPRISQAEAARRLQWSLNRMNAFVKGHRGVTAENAVMLGALTGTSPEFWVNLQMRHDLWHAMKEHGAAAAKVKKIA